MSKKPHIIEIVLALLICGGVAAAAFLGNKFIQTLNLKTYDLITGLGQTEPKVDDVKIVGIDDDSLRQVGRWPWPRPIVAQLIDEVVNQGAAVIGLNIFYFEPAQDEGLAELNRLQSEFAQIYEKHKRAMARKGVPVAPFEDFLYDIEESKYNLDGDAILARSIEEATNVVLPMLFVPGEPLGNNIPQLSAVFSQKEIFNIKGEPESAVNLPYAMAADLPLDQFAKGALAVGHSNLISDVDGSIRQIAPFYQYGKAAYPSFGIQVVREFLNLQRESVKIFPPNHIQMQKAKIPLNDQAATYIRFSGPAGTFPHHSALDVLTGGLPEGTFEGKIVLIGVTANGAVPSYVTPSGSQITGLEIWANHFENILNQRFIERPPWANIAEWGMLVLASLVVILLLPLARAKISIPVSAFLLVAMVGASAFFFINQGWWISPAYGAVVLISGFMVIVGKRLIFTERGKEMVEAEGVETNKMLGLSFQGQGMLDLAFEKFRKCPMDNQMKDLLYNLGLDMERKRQYSKAAAVYEHIQTVDSKYKDIGQKIEFLKKAAEGAVVGGIGRRGSDSTVVVDGLGQNTTLGRYEVIKELGRGAMGIVYLGKDPKINRQVAIKTLRFEDEVSEEQMKTIKERFFREAESAGNLTHPNIIRIFDAGEDQDVAYIAMELLSGKDLKAACEGKNALPLPRVVELVGKVAEALDYAHKQGVVHRDIKPANIMLLEDGTIRITDFGIARVQATSKTSTGAVLGTPAYMSPEQVNGQKVDGRSDIFSLGVTFFELLTGEKPFNADSIAALLFRIANVDAPDPREFNSSIPEPLVKIINKSMAKKIEDRYQNAGEMAQDLWAVMRTLKSGDSPPKETPAKKPVDPKPPQKEANSPTSTPPSTNEESPLSVTEEINKLIKKPEEAEADSPATQNDPQGIETIPPAEAAHETSTPSKEKSETDLDQNRFFEELQDAFNIPKNNGSPDGDKLPEPSLEEDSGIGAPSVPEANPMPDPKLDTTESSASPVEESPLFEDNAIFKTPEETPAIESTGSVNDETAPSSEEETVSPPPQELTENSEGAPEIIRNNSASLSGDDIPMISNIEGNFIPGSSLPDETDEEGNRKAG